MIIFEQSDDTKVYIEFTIMIIFYSLRVKSSLSQISTLASLFAFLQVHNLYWQLFVRHGLLLW
jgi:hypothetical protein